MERGERGDPVKKTKLVLKIGLFVMLSLAVGVRFADAQRDEDRKVWGCSSAEVDSLLKTPAVEDAPAPAIGLTMCEVLRELGGPRSTEYTQTTSGVEVTFFYPEGRVFFTEQKGRMLVLAPSWFPLRSGAVPFIRPLPTDPAIVDSLRRIVTGSTVGNGTRWALDLGSVKVDLTQPGRSCRAVKGMIVMSSSPRESDQTALGFAYDQNVLDTQGRRTPPIEFLADSLQLFVDSTPVRTHASGERGMELTIDGVPSQEDGAWYDLDSLVMTSMSGAKTLRGHVPGLLGDGHCDFAFTPEQVAWLRFFLMHVTRNRTSKPSAAPAVAPPSR
jgi:hypothetical protein